METKENIMEESLQEMKNTAAERTENYQQKQIDGEDQTVLIDQAITGETDELDSKFNQQGPPLDPEDEKFQDEDDDEEFPAKEDLDDDDFDLDPDLDEDLDVNTDEDELY